MEQTIKKYYDADYIIRKNNEYEEMLIYNHPVEKKLRDMIKSVNELCAIENEKCKLRKAKLEQKRLSRIKNKT
jgi:hypothetical protein